jgi:acyl carrier protein
MHTVTSERIQEWLVAQLAERLGMASEAIDVDRPITEYGLDSITGIALAGDLEEWLQIYLSPTLLWDYPTVAYLADHLAGQVQAQMGDADDPQVHQIAHARLDQQHAEQLLARVKTLSDEEVAAILHDVLAA